MALIHKDPPEMERAERRLAAESALALPLAPEFAGTALLVCDRQNHDLPMRCCFGGDFTAFQFEFERFLHLADGAAFGWHRERSRNPSRACAAGASDAVDEVLGNLRHIVIHDMAY